MDASQLAYEATTALTACLPYLMTGGGKIGEGALKQIGADVWHTGTSLWTKLRPKIEAKPEAQEAAQDIVSDPQDMDAQAALRRQIKKLLETDASLADEVTQILLTAKPTGTHATASGKRSVAVGGAVHGSTIITGDKNKAGQ